MRIKIDNFKNSPKYIELGKEFFKYSKNVQIRFLVASTLAIVNRFDSKQTFKIKLEKSPKPKKSLKILVSDGTPPDSIFEPFTVKIKKNKTVETIKENINRHNYDMDRSFKAHCNRIKAKIASGEIRINKKIKQDLDIDC